MHRKIASFAHLMDGELQANAHKGDWESFRDTKSILNELIYHEGKLYEAYELGDRLKIREHILDCANILMFMANSYDLLDEDYKALDYPKHVLLISLPNVSHSMAMIVKKNPVIQTLENDFHIIVAHHEFNMKIVGGFLNNRTTITRVELEELPLFIETYYGTNREENKS